MAKISLRKKLLSLAIGETLMPDAEYEENTLRNNASIVGKEMGRSYSVSKNTETRTFTIIRTA